MYAGTLSHSPLAWGRRILDYLRVLPKSEIVYSQIMRSFDRQGFEEVKRRWYALQAGDNRKQAGALKYLNVPVYLRRNIRLALRLGLDHLPPQRVLDIGSGAGYFLLVCRHFGHDPLGMDVENTLGYDQIFHFFRLRRLIGAVEGRHPLPAFDTPFDLITAIAFVFDVFPDKSSWTLKEWAYFVDDARSRLNPGGRLFLAAATRIGNNPALQDYLLHAPGFETQLLSHYEFMLNRRDG